MNTLIGIVLVLGVVILVHEWGHFIAARFFGVRVDVFSIGFGPRLFGYKRGDTDWRVSALPLGGYVRMAGQDMTDVDSGDKAPTGAPDELMSKKRWQRAIISFAGPGLPKDSAAAKAGLQVGDRITSLNDVQNPTWGTLEADFAKGVSDRTFQITYQRDGQPHSAEVSTAGMTEPTLL